MCVYMQPQDVGADYHPSATGGITAMTSPINQTSFITKTDLYSYYITK